MILAGKTAAVFDQAFALHVEGRLGEAEQLYNRVLLTDPGHVPALSMQGAVALMTGRPERAVELIGRALSLNPDNASAHSNLAYGLMQLGRYAEALASCDAAVALQPDFPDAHNNRGSALMGLGRNADALASFDTAIAQRPDFAAAHSGRGSALMALGRTQEAADSYEAGLGFNPADADLYKNLGIALAELGRLDEALMSFNHSLELNPGQPDVLDAGAVVLCRLKRTAEAVPIFDCAIQMLPDAAILYNNRGNALTYLQQPEAAMADYRRALALDPHDVNTLNNLANALNELDRPEEALAAYDAALALEPGHKVTLWHKALTLLLLGRFAEGWPLYEMRKVTPDPSGAEFADRPLWLGDHDLTGKTLLIHAEQGLGDTLQFCRLAPLVRPLCGRLILQVPAAAHALIASLDDRIEVRSDALPDPDFDFHCPLMSLPLALGLTLETLPAPSRYLAAPQDAVARWQAILGPRARPRIGLAWSGRAAHKNDYNRSIPLTAILPLLGGDADWFGLQKDISDADRALLEASGRMTVLADRLEDFSDTAAVIEALDLVITVDTSVAHLAGALGKPVWILLPSHPDWRWLLGRTDSPWYPSVRLFRQQRFADWSHPLAEAAQALKPLLNA